MRRYGRDLNAIQLVKNRKFADSPLEGTGFEPLVLFVGIREFRISVA